MDNKFIENFLNTDEAKNIFGKKLSLYKNNYEAIASMLDTERDFDVSAETLEQVIDSLKLMQEILSHLPISRNLSLFAINYCNLIETWNRKITKNQDIMRFASFIKRFCDYHLTSIETIVIMKALVADAKKVINSGLNPVRFSNEYLQKINNMIDEEGGDSED